MVVFVVPVSLCVLCEVVFSFACVCVCVCACACTCTCTCTCGVYCDHGVLVDFACCDVDGLSMV